MNSIIRTAACVCLALSLLSCTKNISDPQPDSSSAGQELCVSLPQGTRTALGSPSEGVYPLYWSGGDILSINGKASGEAVIATDKTKSRFSLPDGITAPYSIVYPYKEGFSGAFFPIDQTYVNGSFDSGAAPMCAYTEELVEQLTMTPLAGAVRISLLDSEAGGVTVKSLKLSSEKAFIAGEFALDCRSASITPGQKAAQSLSCVLPSDGLKLSKDTRTDFFITLPKGNLDTIKVQIIAVGGAVMTASFDASGDKAVKAGVVREFKPVKFNKNGEFELLDFNAQADAVGWENDNYLD